MNPGRSEWSTTERKSGPNLMERFDYSSAVYTGRLHLFDVTSGRLRTIETDQADSEILLIENQVVYYRVSDRLYSTEVTQDGLRTAKLLASDEMIRDAHWAFMKR
jgi:hypothetical protein